MEKIKKPILTASHIITCRQKRWILPDAEEMVVGRKAKGVGVDGVGAGYYIAGDIKSNKLSVDFDPELSRRHFSIFWFDGKLLISRIEGSRNPLYFMGEERDEFWVEPGQVFTAGGTKFFVELYEIPEQPETENEFTLSWEEMERARDRNARRCLKALLRIQPVLVKNLEVPDFLIFNLGVLREILSIDQEVVVLNITPARSMKSGRKTGRTGDLPPPICTDQDEYIDIMHSAVACLEHSCALPSQRLVQLALSTGKTAVHVWLEDRTGDTEFTYMPGQKWACCCPVRTSEDRRYAFYLMGFDREPDENKISIASFVAEVVSQHLELRRSLQLQFQVGQFFSPSIRNVLFSSSGMEMLKPKSAETVTLFFDLRGFSRETERAERGETVNGERNRVIGEFYNTLSSILTEATRCIFREKGTIIDYQGDAIVACWGAPEQQEDTSEKAVSAAKEIVKRVYEMNIPFGKKCESGLILKCGVGIAAGNAMEGILNAGEQLKYTLIGSVMNVASRLEGLTKYVGVPILVTGDVIDLLKKGEESTNDILYRRIAKVLPAGMENPVDLYEIVLDREYGGSGVDLEGINIYKKAMERFEKGELDESLLYLSKMPQEDPVAQFLKKQINEIGDIEFPGRWDGVIRFERK